MENTPDFDSPFGTYPPTKAHSLALKTLHSAPRALLRKVNKIFMQKRQTTILDVSVAGLNLRFQPGIDLIHQTMLRRRKREKYDLTERRAIENICRLTETPFFIDIGSHLGTYSYLLTKSIPNLRVIAIEPQPVLYNTLVFNFKTNNLNAIEVLNCAVSDYSGTTKMNFSLPLNLIHIDPSGDTEVNCRTLADIVKDSGVASVEAIKIDVEGYEDRVIVPYLNTMPTSLWPKVLITEFACSDRWIQNPVDAAISRGYIEKARTNLNSILVKNTKQ